MSESAAPTSATRLVPFVTSRYGSAAALRVDTGRLATECVAVEDPADVGRVPLLRRAVLLGGEDLLAHLPTLVQREVVADEAQPLPRHVQRLVGGEPHHARRGVAGVHR